MSKVDFESELSPITEQLSTNLKINGSAHNETEEEFPPSDEEFSFASARFDSFSADDVFSNGQISPIFPFFDQSLISSDYSAVEEDLSLRSPVKKVLVETPAGMYRELAAKSAGASPDTCEKSNSTGFSTMWRSREMEQRSNSDGRDAFVFLRESEGREKGPAKGQKGDNKKRTGKKATSSAHEMLYVENRERREKDKKRSYLPYRPGLFGFFANVSGGLSKNLHPY